MHKVVYDQPFSCIYCQEGFPNTEELLRHQQVWALTQLHLLKIFAKRIIVNSVFYIHTGFFNRFCGNKHNRFSETLSLGTLGHVIKAQT